VLKEEVKKDTKEKENAGGVAS